MVTLQQKQTALSNMYRLFLSKPGMSYATYHPNKGELGPRVSFCFHDILIELRMDDEGKYFDELGRFGACTEDEAEEEISFNLTLANSRF